MKDRHPSLLSPLHSHPLRIVLQCAPFSVSPCDRRSIDRSINPGHSVRANHLLAGVSEYTSDNTIVLFGAFGVIVVESLSLCAGHQHQSAALPHCTHQTEHQFHTERHTHPSTMMRRALSSISTRVVCVGAPSRGLSSTPSPPPPPRTAEAAAPAASDSSRLATDSRIASIAFARWLSSCGVRFNSSSDHRPLFGLKRYPSNPNEWLLASASRKIEKGETIFKIPQTITIAPSSLMSDATARQQLQHIWSDLPSELWQLKNGLRLLYEYGLMVSPQPGITHDSLYAPYINLLPASYSTVPLFWSAGELDATQYQPLATQVKLRSGVVRGLAPALSSMTHLYGPNAATVGTAERIGWAMTSVSSRAFQIRPDECANLPLIDMMNHSYANNCKVTLDPSTGDIKVDAVSEIQPGSELTLNYGYHTNDAFLLNYGFMLDENVADHLQIAKNPDSLLLALDMAGEPSIDTPEQVWKKAILAELIPSASAPSSAASHFYLTRDAIDPALIAYVKVLVAQSNTIAESDRNLAFFMRDTGSLGSVVGASTSSSSSVVGGSTSSSASSGAFVTPSQDLILLPPSAARVLFSYLSLLQSSFPTSLQEDVDSLSKLIETMLTSEPNPKRAEEVQRSELAIRFRIGKKRILAEQMKRIQQRM